MALNEGFRDFVLDQLHGLGQFETRKMFGGVALLYNGSAFAKIKHDKVWLKVDERNKNGFKEAGMMQYTYGKDNSRTLNFYETPLEIIEDRGKFIEWAEESIKIASTSK
ncbi:MAG: TfoX/Sxy family protein [Reichenbachiella sp.]|uniref:TfoX/Sxy family protein n=1 Tax=Reichenbachiella sp. TaxID=2184521 RepID=UPI0032634227